MHFLSDAMADFEGLLEVNRKICKQQMAEKASPTLPTNCAVLPQVSKRAVLSRFRTARRVFVDKHRHHEDNGNEPHTKDNGREKEDAV